MKYTRSKSHINITCQYIAIFSILILLNSCEEEIEPLPEVETIEVVNITENSAVVLCKVPESNTATILERGIVYASLPYLDIDEDIVIKMGKGNGEFEVTMQNLDADSKYWVCAYAKGSEGITYGNSLSFFTTKQLPEVYLGAISSITDYAVTFFGKINDYGDYSYKHCGFCWNTEGNPTIDDEFILPDRLLTSGLVSDDDYGSIVYGLSPSTKYYVRAFVAYGDSYNTPSSEYKYVYSELEKAFTTKASYSLQGDTWLKYDDGSASSDHIIMSTASGTQFLNMFEVPYDYGKVRLKSISVSIDYNYTSSLSRFDVVCYKKIKNGFNYVPDDRVTLLSNQNSPSNDGWVEFQVSTELAGGTFYVGLIQKNSYSLSLDFDYKGNNNANGNSILYSNSNWSSLNDSYLMIRAQIEDIPNE